MERATVRRGVIVVCAALTQLAAGGLRAPAGAQTSEVETDRMAGDSRFATSALIAQRSFPGGTEVVYLARGDAFADALAAGTLSDDPILLASPCGALPEVIRGEIDRLAPYRVVALGGEGAVCEDLLQQAAAGRESTRLAGGSRFETAAVIADIAFPEGAATVYLANGADSPDAVAGGALTDGPILLLPPDGSLLDVVTAAIERLDPERVVALGGPVVVTDAQLQGAAGGRPTDRLFGADRFATAVAIAREAHGTTAATIYLARAELFADAVAAGSLADGPVLLVPTCGDLPAAVAHHLANAAADRVFALGGPLAVCDELLDAAAQRLTPVTRAGTIVFERFREDERLDRTLGELWAMDADGGNVRLLAAPDLEGPVEEPGDIQRDISYTRPSLIGPNATDVVFSGPAIWFASTPVPCPPAPYICPVHVGFGVSGVLRWRDGVVTRETPEPEFCVGCSSFFTHPTRTADGGWVAWCEHYQGAFLDYTNDRAVGRPTGLWQFTDRKPCLPVQDALGPIRGHPQDPDTVAYLACTTDDGAHGVWVSDAAGERPRRVADVRVDDAAHDEGLGLAWTDDGDLLVRGVDAAALEDAGFYRFDPARAPEEQEPVLVLVLREPLGVMLGPPVQMGNRLLFHARDLGDDPADAGDDTWALWTVSADCEGCRFPDDATRLTQGGRSRHPSFTAEHRIDAVAAKPCPPGRCWPYRAARSMAGRAAPRRVHTLWTALPGRIAGDCQRPDPSTSQIDLGFPQTR